MYGWRAKIGLLVPSVNNTLEMDMHRLAPPGIAIHTARMWWSETPDATVNVLENTVGQIIEPAKNVASAGVDVIAYGCTSGSFFKGAGWDKEVASIIHKSTGVPAVTTATAMLEALKSSGIKNVCVVTPYPDEVNRRLRSFLENNNCEVVELFGMDIKDARKHATVDTGDIYRAAREIFKAPGEGVFIACTQLRALDVIEVLEQDLGVPVIGAGQALFWLALKTVKVRGSIHGYGKLLETF